MRVLITGATGMVGHGVLRECLLDPDVDDVRTLGRSSTGRTEPSLHEVLHSDFMNLGPVESDLMGIDAAFLCLGVSSAGMDKEEYRHITYDYTLSVAETLLRLNPDVVIVYVSGAGTDSSERGRSAWARVKGATENALRAMTPNAYMFRPGIIRPVHGAVSKTRAYRVLYSVGGPLFSSVQLLAPNAVTTTDQIGVAMLHVARYGSSTPIWSTKEINAAHRA